jgi:hypothetical protein
MEQFKGLTVIEIMDLLINEIDGDELMELWNSYCDEINAHDNMVYYNDEETLQIICDDYMSVAQKITYGKYNYAHEYLTLNGYANFESADFVAWLITVDDLAGWLHEKQKAE